jgi:sodium-dependent phosphate transporter
MSATESLAQASRQLLAGATETKQFEWMCVCGGFLAFFAAFGIGANDVANAFATSVGSGALSIKNAVVLAGIFEFCGAMFMGGHVVKTIRKGIADQDCFENDPGLLMYGCLCVIFAVSIWLVLASFLEMPVSTTHSCVGGMIGMTMVARGSSCVVWTKKSDTFPFVGGVVAIVISWLLSPVVSGGFAFVFFVALRALVMRSEHSFSRASVAFPVLLACTLIINIFFIVYKGAKFLELDDTPLSTAFAVAFGVGGGVGIIAYFTVTPYILKTTEELYEKMQLEKAELGSGVKKVEEKVVRQPREYPTGVMGAPLRVWYALCDHLEHSLAHKADDILEEDKAVQAIHENAEKFDEKTELSMRYLQILTACCDSFAHGANDVANSIGPFASMIVIFRSGEVSSKAEMGSDSYWILGLGAAGIVAGLALYGYKILHALGTKIAKLTPSRGICIELGAACVIIMGSRLGWPLSTTHCQVGATVGVAMLEGRKGINWFIIGKTIFGWIITLVVVGLSTAAFFAQGAFAPMVNYPNYL